MRYLFLRLLGGVDLAAEINHHAQEGWRVQSFQVRDEREQRGAELVTVVVTYVLMEREVPQPIANA